MKKREFIKSGAALTVGAIVNPLSSYNAISRSSNFLSSEITDRFILPNLPYGYDKLEPYIDTQTMRIHHRKHHAGYVRKLNAALEGPSLKGHSLTSILNLTDSNPNMVGIRNNGGGHFNHSLFWKIMAPGGGQSPSGVLNDAIVSTFGSVENFNLEFGKAAATRFGSGWGWLCVDSNGKLFIDSTANQDNPLMTKITQRPGTPILGIDVWEHAYYLKYQNRRKDYIGNFLNIVNWDQVAKNYSAV